MAENCITLKKRPSVAARMKSDISHARLDDRSRHQKAQKIISILSTHCDFRNANVIDIGTGSGHIISDIARGCKSATSVDLYDERVEKRGYLFRKVQDERLPFKDGAFDVAISNHVLEHVPNQRMHIAEIHRVLKRGGVFYLATPNRWWWKDPHYQIPFITWLPRSLSQALFQRFKGKGWDIYSLSYSKIKRLAKGRFALFNATIDVIKNPGKYHLDTLKDLQPITSRIPTFLLRALNGLFPTYILILKKK